MFAQPINESQKLLKSAAKQFYSTFSSFWVRLSRQKVIFSWFEIWGRRINKFVPNHVYLRPNIERLPLPIQFSKKPKTFYCSFIAFLESKLNLQHFQKILSFIE